MKYTFIRNNPVSENRKAVEDGISEYAIRGCFSMCTQEVRDRLESFFTDRQQESIKFEFGDETVEVRRDG